MSAEHHHFTHLQTPGGFTGSIVFVCYSTLPKSPEAKIPPAKRTAYFAFAKKGVEFTKVLEKSKVTYQVVFKDARNVTAVTDADNHFPYSLADLAKAIGTGTPPFKPNGAFTIFKQGKPETIILAFEKAHLDPKTNDLTLTVSFLRAAQTPADQVPAEFMMDHPFTSDHSTMLFLDQFESNPGIGGM